MNTQEQIQALAQMVSKYSGRMDAMMAALSGVLDAAREQPEVLAAVSEKLEICYASHLASNRNPFFVEGFEAALDSISSQLAQPDRANILPG
jgi:hypothetical protein